MKRTTTPSLVLAALLLTGGSVALAPPELSAADCRCPSPATATARTVSRNVQSANNVAEPATLDHAGPLPQAAGDVAAGYPAGYYGQPGPGQGWLAAVHASHYAPNCRPQMYGQPDLFANYYLPPNCGGVGAEIYPAPYGGIPPLVGHTYYTYQPLAPHELLYPHHRTYHRYYNGGRGLTRARVHWYSPPVRAAGDYVLDHFRIPR